MTLFKHLYIQVLIAIFLGGAVAAWFPDFAVKLNPLATGFIKLIKMMIGPIVFTTVALGIARMGGPKTAGRLSLKALVYFETVSTLALVIGLVVGNLLQSGAGIHADPASLDVEAVKGYTSGARHLNTVDFLLDIIPHSAVDAFARGEILQVLLFSVVFGLAVGHLSDHARNVARDAEEAERKDHPGRAAALRRRSEFIIEARERVIRGLETLEIAFFEIIHLITRLAPLGAFGAIAFTLGKYGLGVLWSLGMLMAGVYLTCFFFVVLILGAVARWTGYRLWNLIKYLREELLIVLGTSSSEAVLPALMEKLETLGCRRAVVGLVTPLGYSFNLDGSAIYLTMAVVFIAQATGVAFGMDQQLGILAVLLLTSKGAAAVTGGAFVTLAATLAAQDTLPVAGLALLLGVDRFMSEARALTNLVGNAVATLAIARWEKALDQEKLAVTIAYPHLSDPGNSC
ncbi:MAG: cation:dicarboxylase symporter family transporter [Methylococcaceae bacterium]|nr:cation:dicarboxylase symporter family transporter [Methylococcaceae bacterium]